MNEVTDPQKLHTINMQVQNIPITQDPGLQWRVYRAWEYPSNSTQFEPEWIPTLYQVEIRNNYQYGLNGVLDSTRGLLYLDTNSILMLVQDRIEATLTVFNAGHHWRFKGV